MLTGKVKENFEKWLFENHRIQFMDGFNNLPETCQYALIIDFFDTLKWFINFKSKFGQRKQRERFMFHIKNYKSEFLYDSRLEAKKEAIIKTDCLLNAKLLKAVC